MITLAALANVAWGVWFLPLVAVLLSFLAESRRAAVAIVLAGTVAALVAAAVVADVALVHPLHVFQTGITYWSYPVIQSPFNAHGQAFLASTSLAVVGVRVDPLGAILALTVTAAAALALARLWLASGGAGDASALARLVGLATTTLLGIVLAPNLLQMLLGWGVLGLCGYLVTARGGPGRAGTAAGRAFLRWQVGTVALWLAAIFLYAKFSGAIQAHAVSAKHPHAPVPDGLNFTALAQRWQVVLHHGVPGADGRTLVVAAVLLLVAVAAAAGLVPGQGQAADASEAPQGMASFTVSLWFGVAGVVLVARTYLLFELAIHLLPALALLAGVSALVGALQALGGASLPRVVAWLAASQVATALAGLGLGAFTGGIALLLTTVLAATAALLGAADLGQRQGSLRLARLAGCWSDAAGRRQGAMAGLGLGLVGLAGVAGVGGFFPRVAVLAAAFNGQLPAGPHVGVLTRALTAGLLLLAAAVGAAAATRVVRILVVGDPGPVSRSGRAARLVVVPAGVADVAVVAGVATLLAGLAALPGVGASLGRVVVDARGVPGLPLDLRALLLVLVAPLVGVALAARVRPDRLLELGRGARAERLRALGGLTDLWDAAEARLLGPAARLVLATDRRLLGPALGWVAQGTEALARLGDDAARRRSTAAVRTGALVVGAALLVWWLGVAHAPVAGR